MRAWMLTIAALIIFTVGIWLYSWHVPDDAISPLPTSLKLIGVIDMDANHGINIKGLKQGSDILMVLDYVGFVNQFMPAHPELKEIYAKPFDLANYDNNQNGEIDNTESIWPYLYVVTYGEDGATYQVRHLADAGIHAILTQHLNTTGNHKVLLTDGDTRILYEVSRLSEGGNAGG